MIDEQMKAHEEVLMEQLASDYGATPKGMRFPENTPEWFKPYADRFHNGTYRIGKPIGRNLAMMTGKANSNSQYRALAQLREVGFGVFFDDDNQLEIDESTISRKTGLRQRKVRYKNDPRIEIDATAFLFEPQQPLFSDLEEFSEWYVSAWEPFCDEPEGFVDWLSSNKRFQSILNKCNDSHDTKMLANRHWLNEWNKVPKSEEQIQEVKQNSVREAIENNRNLRFSLGVSYNLSSEPSEVSLLERVLMKGGSVKHTIEKIIAEHGLNEVVKCLEQLEEEQRQKLGVVA